jgi:tetratricopeptide (TPR) repeat protein
MTRCTIVLLAVALVPGCAARRHQSTPFIKPGKPAVEIGKPLDGKPQNFEAYVTQLRELAVRARRNPTGSLLPTVETRDRALAAALLRVVIEPTPAAHRAVAERYRDLGIPDLAYDHFERATQLDRTDAAAYEGLARVWRDWGFPQLGLADANRAVYYAPSSASARNTLGTLLVALGQRPEARAAYEKALELDGAAAYALNNLCYLSFLEGKPIQAVSECREALALDPTLKSARNNLALANVAAGRSDVARSDFLAAGGTAEAFYNIGIAQMAAKHYAAALAAFNAARSERPAWRAAQQRARQASRLLNASARAND